MKMAIKQVRTYLKTGRHAKLNSVSLFCELHQFLNSLKHTLRLKPRYRVNFIAICAQITHNELFEAREGLFHSVGSENLTLHGRLFS